MSDEVQAKLEHELVAVKALLSDASAEVERSKKEIGNLRKEAAKVSQLKEEKADIVAALASASAKIRALEASLADAGKKLATLAEQAAAGQAIADALKVFSK